jgi:hypothetical protein
MIETPQIKGKHGQTPPRREWFGVLQIHAGLTVVQLIAWTELQEKKSVVL